MLPHVRRWFDRSTSRSEDWQIDSLLAAKGQQRISVVLPARNEQETVGDIVAPIRGELVDAVGLVDELVVMDSRSTDATARVAADAGASVFSVDMVLPHLGTRDGKGEALWKSLAVTSGDLVVFLDADLQSFSTAYVTGLLGPLLTDPEVWFVKAAYERSLALGTERTLTGGGRVTEFAARPVLNAHWPDLAGVLQPLAGEYAARRHALEQVPFACGYGVELALLVDLLQMGGLSSLAQVDLGHRVHRNRDDADLVPMASAVLQAAARRLPGARPVSTSVTQFDRQGGSYMPKTVDVLDDERPPLCGPAAVVPFLAGVVMPHPVLRQLYPGPSTQATLPAVYEPTAHLATASRPHVTVNMVASVDGATAVDGVTASLSSAGDKEIFLLLRGQADVVLVGAGTVRAEAYGSVKADEPTRAARRERGQTATATLAIVTASLALDWSSPLFTDSAVRPFVITTRNADPARLEAARRCATLVVAGEELVDLSGALTSLRRDHGVGNVLCEGGPRLNHDMLVNGLVDQLCLTVAPTLLGGGSTSIFGREALPKDTALDLASALTDGSALFLRYQVRR